MNTNEAKLKEATVSYFAVKKRTFAEAIKSGKDLEQAVKLAREAHQKAHPGRGGARPGAGRKPGTGQGRRDTARLEFCVSVEFKAKFEEAAQKNGWTKIELLKRLFDGANL